MAAEIIVNRIHRKLSGGVRERPNRRAWKAREAKASVGSNPTPSATIPERQRVANYCRGLSLW